MSEVNNFVQKLFSQSPNAIFEAVRWFKAHPEVAEETPAVLGCLIDLVADDDLEIRALATEALIGMRESLQRHPNLLRYIEELVVGLARQDDFDVILRLGDVVKAVAELPALTATAATVAI